MKAYIKKRTFGGQMPILCSPDLVQEGQQHWGISVYTGEAPITQGQRGSLILDGANSPD